MVSLDGTTTISSSRLLALPGELRNTIWQCTFNTAEDDINLLTAKGPSPALLRTCHQLYAEARDYYKTANDRYWKTKSFVLDYQPKDHDRLVDAIYNLNEGELIQVTKLIVQGLRDTHAYDNEYGRAPRLVARIVTGIVLAVLSSKEAVRSSQREPRGTAG